MEEQLRDLYGERERLCDRFNVTDTSSVIEMIENLEAQLVSLYDEKSAAANDPALTIAPMVAEIRATTSAMKELYSQIELSLEGGHGPTQWKITGRS
jgi:hypothetical protein